MSGECTFCGFPLDEHTQSASCSPWRKANNLLRPDELLRMSLRPEEGSDG